MLSEKYHLTVWHHTGSKQYKYRVIMLSEKYYFTVWHHTGSKQYKYRVIMLSEKYHLSLATANPPSMWTVGCATLTLEKIPQEVAKNN